MTLLVTALDPAQADALYQDLGDARAFGVVHEHFQRLGTLIRQGGGAVVKTMGEGLLASFSDVTAAVKTALELARPARDHRVRGDRVRSAFGSAFTAVRPWPPPSTISSTISARRPGRPPPSCNTPAATELVLTRTVAADPEVAALLSERQIESEVVATNLAGHPHVIRVRLDPVEVG